jgi:hypothetical protein
MLDKLLQIEDYFNHNKEVLIPKHATEMNKKHTIISSSMLEIEKIYRVPEHITDKLMFSILVIWYVVEKCYYKRISTITVNNIIENERLFHSLKSNSIRNYEQIRLINFIKYENNLLEYAIIKLRQVELDLSKHSQDVLIRYLSIIKSFEDKLEYTKKII